MNDSMPNFSLLLTEIKQAILEKGNFIKMKANPKLYYSHVTDPNDTNIIDRESELVKWLDFKDDVMGVIGKDHVDTSRYSTFGWGFRIEYESGWFCFNISLLLNYYTFWEIDRGTRRPNFMITLFREQMVLISPIIGKHYTNYERLPIEISTYEYWDLRIEGGQGGREATTFDILFNDTLITPERYRI